MKSGLTLWALVFAGPIAWFLDLEANFAFSTQACAGFWSAAPAFASFIALIVTASAGILSWNRWREARQTEPPGPKTYQGVALGGVILSAAFSIVIVAESIPVVMLRNCK
jgi:hypothetical protein